MILISFKCKFTSQINLFYFMKSSGSHFIKCLMNLRKNFYSHYVPTTPHPTLSSSKFVYTTLIPNLANTKFDDSYLSMSLDVNQLSPILICFLAIKSLIRNFLIYCFFLYHRLMIKILKTIFIESCIGPNNYKNIL